METVESLLREQADEEYRQFMTKLLPTVQPERIIGVRTPALRQLARKLRDTETAACFLQSLPHRYYEENNLHGFLIEQEAKSYEQAVAMTKLFLPYIDNWATCDGFSPKAFLKQPKEFAEQTLQWMKSDRPYTVRYGIVMQIKFFMKERFEERFLKAVAAVKSEEYYVNMAVAWYLSQALLFHREQTAVVFESGQLLPFVQNKALQKASESLLASKEDRALFAAMKRPGREI